MHVRTPFPAARATFVAVLLALALPSPRIASAQVLDCAFADSFEVVDPCATRNGCPVPQPAAGASAQIAAARSAPDGTTDILIAGPLVSVLEPAIGGAPGGFFVQAARTGPALFVAVDPATLAPAPTPGDLVEFRVTRMETTLAQRRGAGISGWTVHGRGGRVDCLVQDVSDATDLVSGLASYESEVVRIDGSVVAPATDAEAGFRSAPIDIPGIAGDPLLRLRVPSTLDDALALDAGCAFTLDAAPLWRRDAAALPSAYVATDFTLLDCPAPVVLSASAIDPTHVEVVFSRPLDPGSIAPDGSQFSFDQGLVATAALASGRSVLLTTTAQMEVAYAVVVAASVRDVGGTPLGTPNAATFQGIRARAVLRIDELNATITGGCDLVELTVRSAGSMEGVELLERTAPVLAFTAFEVQAGQRIVVHLNGSGVTCNPGGAPSETTAPDGQPQALHARNYDGAFDWYSTDTGLVSTDSVLTLRARDGTIMDAVFVSDDPAGTAAADTETQAATVAAAGEWTTVAGGVPPGGFVEDAFNAHAVQDLDGTGTTPGGTSIQRTSSVDTNDLQGWGMAVSSFGAANAGVQ